MDFGRPTDSAGGLRIGPKPVWLGTTWARSLASSGGPGGLQLSLKATEEEIEEGLIVVLDREAGANPLTQQGRVTMVATIVLVASACLPC